MWLLYCPKKGLLRDLTRFCAPRRRATPCHGSGCPSWTVYGVTSPKAKDLETPCKIPCHSSHPPLHCGTLLWPGWGRTLRWPQLLGSTPLFCTVSVDNIQISSLLRSPRSATLLPPGDATPLCGNVSMLSHIKNWSEFLNAHSLYSPNSRQKRDEKSPFQSGFPARFFTGSSRAVS